MAVDVLWIGIVSILFTFNIAKAKDEGGKDIEVSPAFSDAIIRYLNYCWVVTAYFIHEELIVILYRFVVRLLLVHLKLCDYY